MLHYSLLNAVLLTGLLLATTLFNQADADSGQPYPEFVAKYDATASGFTIGNVTISLRREGNNKYIYRQESNSSGIAALFGNNTSFESSLWQLDNGHIKVLEYQSKRKGGDEDDNEHLLFDWENSTVKNIGDGDRWVIPLPENALDRLVMQLAILFELRDGKKEFSYEVPRQGRIKNYRFALLGEEEIELTSGMYKTLKVGRTDDDRDQSWVWSAPELDYFPIRFLKKKQSGINIELILRKLDFAPFGDGTSLEVEPLRP